MSESHTPAPVVDDVPSQEPVSDPPAPAGEPEPPPEPERAAPALQDDRVTAIASAMTELLKLVLGSRSALLDAFTPVSASRVAALASDSQGLDGAVVFNAPAIAAVGYQRSDTALCAKSESALSTSLGSQYKLATLSPTALAEQLPNEPALLAHLRSLSPSVDVLAAHPFLEMVMTPSAEQGTSTAYEVHAATLRDFLTGANASPDGSTG